MIKVAINSDGTTVISGATDGCIMVWEVSSGENLHKLNTHTTCITTLTFLSNEKFILSCKMIFIYSEKDHKCVFERLNERHRSIQENHTVLVPLKFYRAFFIFLQTISKTQQRTKNYFGTLLEK